MAILILYHQTFATRRFRVGVYVIGAVILADFVALFFAICFYCVPIAALFDPKVPGKCVNRALFTTIASSTLLLTDLVLHIMPMPIILKLYMATRRKLELALIFALGAV